MLGIAKKLFGSSNDRKVKDFMGRVQKINALEAKFAALSDDELRMMTQTLPRPAGRRRDARQDHERGLRRRARGLQAGAGPAPV